MVPGPLPAADQRPTTGGAARQQPESHRLLAETDGYPGTGSVQGDITLDPAHPAQGKAELTIQIAGISLPTADATAQAQKPEWFSASRYPTAHFITNSIRPLGNNRFQFSGTLSIKGTSRVVSAPFTLSRQGSLNVVEGTLPVSRLAFKVGEGDWADTDTVADTVSIQFHVAYPGSK
jgi:polyisoprenoid-binding protein YceI